MRRLIVSFSLPLCENSEAYLKAIMLQQLKTLVLSQRPTPCQWVSQNESNNSYQWQTHWHTVPLFQPAHSLCRLWFRIEGISALRLSGFLPARSPLVNSLGHTLGSGSHVVCIGWNSVCFGRNVFSEIMKSTFYYNCQHKKPMLSCLVHRGFVHEQCTFKDWCPRDACNLKLTTTTKL